MFYQWMAFPSTLIIKLLEKKTHFIDSKGPLKLPMAMNLFKLPKCEGYRGEKYYIGCFLKSEIEIPYLVNKIQLK